MPIRQRQLVMVWRSGAGKVELLLAAMLARKPSTLPPAAITCCWPRRDLCRDRASTITDPPCRHGARRPLSRRGSRQLGPRATPRSPQTRPRPLRTPPVSALAISRRRCHHCSTSPHISFGSSRRSSRWPWTARDPLHGRGPTSRLGRFDLARATLLGRAVLPNDRCRASVRRALEEAARLARRPRGRSTAYARRPPPAAAADRLWRHGGPGAATMTAEHLSLFWSRYTSFDSHQTSLGGWGGGR